MIFGVELWLFVSVGVVVRVVKVGSSFFFIGIGGRKEGKVFKVVML